MIRPSTMVDVDSIVNILSEARTTIASLGIDQWQNGYPSKDVVLDDIRKERSYVVVGKDDRICGTFALIKDGEPTYRKIYEGSWLTGESPYVALHRIAIAKAFRGQGLAEEIIRFLEQTGHACRASGVRVDTHTGNIPMRKMLERNGFSYCGIIYLSDGQKRVAYEKELE